MAAADRGLEILPLHEQRQYETIHELLPQTSFKFESTSRSVAVLLLHLWLPFLVVRRSIDDTSHVNRTGSLNRKNPTPLEGNLTKLLGRHEVSPRDQISKVLPPGGNSHSSDCRDPRGLLFLTPRGLYGPTLWHKDRVCENVSNWI